MGGEARKQAKQYLFTQGAPSSKRWKLGFPNNKLSYPKDHWTLKTGYFEDPNPAIQVQTLPLEGPRSLGYDTDHYITNPNFMHFSMGNPSKLQSQHLHQL